MAVRLRLQRHGARHAPAYRVVAADARSPRDGRFVEILGSYNPRAGTPELQLTLKGARIDYWLGVGAIPSQTVRSLILRAKREGRYVPELREEPAEGQESAPEILDASPGSQVDGSMDSSDHEGAGENGGESTGQSDEGVAGESAPSKTSAS